MKKMVNTEGYKQHVPRHPSPGVLSAGTEDNRLVPKKVPQFQQFTHDSIGDTEIFPTKGHS